MPYHSRMLTNELRDVVVSCGASLVGVADLSPAPAPLRRGFPRAVSIGKALPADIVRGIGDGPTVAYRRVYDDYNEQLTAIAGKTAAWLASRGWACEARPASHDIDWKTVSAPFSHKMAATLAGMGWIGKCDLLVTDQFGSAVRWSSVLTNAPLDVGTPVVESRCGDCAACVAVCPGRACSGKLWRQGMAREDFWDPHACMAGMKSVNARIGIETHICGMCIAACPRTRAYLARSAAAGRP